MYNFPLGMGEFRIPILPRSCPAPVLFCALEAAVCQPEPGTNSFMTWSWSANFHPKPPQHVDPEGQPGLYQSRSHPNCCFSLNRLIDKTRIGSPHASREGLRLVLSVCHLVIYSDFRQIENPKSDVFTALQHQSQATLIPEGSAHALQVQAPATPFAGQRVFRVFGRSQEWPKDDVVCDSAHGLSRIDFRNDAGQTDQMESPITSLACVSVRVVWEVGTNRM